MALQGKFEFSGIEIPAAYVRIERVDVEQKTRATIHAAVYANAQMAASEAPMALTYLPVEGTYDFAASENLLAQSYAQLKAKGKPFAGFSDC